MQTLLEPIAGRTVPALPATGDGAAQRRARMTLRAQIGRLEGQLAGLAAESHLRLAPECGSGSLAGPRVLSLGELERVRDELAGAVACARAATAAQAERQAARRRVLESMLLEPGRHRFERVTAAEIGEPSCRAWTVRPRLGPVGLLLGWWRVTVSSGCPLAAGPRRPPRARRP